MIRVPRNRVRTPDIFVGPDSLAARELAEVVRHEQRRKSKASRTTAKQPVHRRGGQKTRGSFAFKVYSRREVKEALAELFHGKCAYCETPYAATQPVDVEHYRPKAAVEGDEEHPGYYWLAADWDNLLPSCIDCNRLRIQQLYNGEGEPRREVKLGKGNRFPLATGSRRAQTPDDPIVEQPLLLHPCRDHPEAALSFSDDAIVHPTANSGETEQQARASIEVYGLNRTGLVLNRLEVLRLLQGRMYSIVSLVKVLDHPLEEEVRGLVEDLLAHELAELDGFRRPQRPYSLMCAQAIDRFKVILLGAADGRASGQRHDSPSHSGSFDPG